MNNLSMLDDVILFGNVKKALITPEIAKKYLSKSKGNRALRRGKVESYKQDMLSGNWEYNGDAIRFLEDGTLFDGHHRLTAIAESGISVYANIITISESATKTIDKGVTRTVSDDFHFEYGYNPQDSATVTSSIKHIIIHDRKMDQWAKGSAGGYSAKWITSSEIIRWYEKNNSEIKPSLAWVNEKITKNRTFVPKGSVCALHFLSGRRYGDDAIYFLNTVFTGHGIVPDSNADYLRNWLIAAAMGQNKSDKERRILTIARVIRSEMAGRNFKSGDNISFFPSKGNIPFLI